MALMLRHVVGLQRTLDESPTRFKPLLYLAEQERPKGDKSPGEATAWCEGYMAGVKLRDDEWQPIYESREARDWIFPLEALAYGDTDPEFSEWIDDKEKRASLVDELALAVVLITAGTSAQAEGARERGSRRDPPDGGRKTRERLLQAPASADLVADLDEVPVGIAHGAIAAAPSRRSSRPALRRSRRPAHSGGMTSSSGTVVAGRNRPRRARIVRVRDELTAS